MSCYSSVFNFPTYFNSPAPFNSGCENASACPTQTQILLAIQTQIQSLGYQSGLVIQKEIPNFKGGVPNFLASETFVLIVPGEIVEIEELAKGGGRFTAGLKGKLLLNIYQRSGLDLAYTDPVKVDKLRKATIGVLNGLEMFYPTDSYGNKLTIQPIRFVEIDRPRVFKENPEWIFTTIEYEFEWIACCSFNVGEVIVYPIPYPEGNRGYLDGLELNSSSIDDGVQTGSGYVDGTYGAYGIINGILNQGLITSDQIFISTLKEEQLLRIAPYMVLVVPGNREVLESYQDGGGRYINCFYEYVSVIIFGRVALDYGFFNISTLTDSSVGILTLADQIINALQISYFVDSNGRQITFEPIRIISQSQPSLYDRDRNFCYVEQIWEVPQKTLVDEQIWEIVG